MPRLCTAGAVPGWWIAVVVTVLNLGRSPAMAADSLSTAPVVADTLGVVAAPAGGDSLQFPATAADSLPESVVEVLPPRSIHPALPPSSPPTAAYLPRQARFVAQRRGLLTTRTLWTAGCLGGSLVLYQRGGDYRDKADRLYALYQRESDPTEIGSLYQRTTNQDTKGQVCWALSAALAVNGVRLLFTRETEVVSAEVSRSPLQMILTPQNIQLRVRKWL